MEIVTELRTETIIDGQQNENLILNIDYKNNKIQLKVAQNKMFSTLKNRFIIFGFIQKEINDLLEKHLSNMEKKEVDLNGQR